MHDFKFKNGELHCEEVKVRDVAAKVGTPFYLYSHNTVRDHFTKIQKAFAPVKPLICFAMKSNDNLAVLKTLANLDAGFDIVSGGELKKALAYRRCRQIRSFSLPLAKPRRDHRTRSTRGSFYLTWNLCRNWRKFIVSPEK